MEKKDPGKTTKIPVLSTFEEVTKDLELTSTSYEELLDKICSNFHLTKQRVLTYYLDDEKDQIFFSSDRELEYALTLVDLPLRISLGYKVEADLSSIVSSLKIRNNPNKRKAKEDQRKVKKRRISMAKTFQVLKTIPDNVKVVYLDANNVIPAGIVERPKGTSFKRWRRKAQESLIVMCSAFLGQASNFKFVLVFDRLKEKTPQTLSDSAQLEVRGLRKGFKSADDDLVDLASSGCSDSLFVTSDRELIGRLIEVNVKWIMHSGTFVRLAKRATQDQSGKSKEAPGDVVKKETEDDLVESLNEMELNGPVEAC